MAENATPSLTVNQGTDPYKMWNSDDWFDNIRWGLTGTMADSDFKSGLWWKDGQAMQRAVPILHQFADQWRDQIKQLKAMLEKTDQSSQTFNTNQGVNAARTTSALADISRAIQQKIDDLTPVPAAMENAAAVIERNAPIVENYWNKWENDRANFETCHADVVAMQGPISNMARAFLQAADAIQTPWKNSLKSPNITMANNLNGNSSIDPGIQAHLNSGPTPAESASKAAAAANTANTAANDTGGPALAGSGFGSAFASGGAPQSGLGGVPSTIPGNPIPSGATITPTSSPGGGGFMPPGFVGGAAFGGGTGNGRSTAPVSEPGEGTPLFPVTGGNGAAGTGRRRNFMDDEDDSGAGKGAGARRGVAAPPPLIGGMGAGTASGRRRTEIRPGDKERPRTVGVAQGLLGRAAKGSEFDPLAGSVSTRRRRSTRRDRDDRNDTVQFLDEEAWLTDDPGTGVVEAETPEEQTIAAPMLRGTPSVG